MTLHVQHRALGLGLAFIAGCAPTLGEQTQAIVGGSTDTSDTAIVALEIAGGACSGIVVAPRVVLTAAHCALPGVGLAQPGIAQFGASAPFASTASIVELWIDRAYVGDVDHDLAAVRLDSDAPATPLQIGAPGAVGDPLTLVGFGETAPDAADTRGTRRAVTAMITAIAPRDLGAGALGATTCVGDSGGAAIATDGAVVGVVSAGDDDCDGAAQFVRPDSEPELAEVIAAWSGSCPADGICDPTCAVADPDCDPCAFQGTCASDCPAVDLDCPLGGAPGATCVVATDCESRDCEPAPEGSDRGAFCSAPCATAADCPAPLGACPSTTCVYAGPTPGIAGATCTADADCRGALCDLGAGVCAVPCGDDNSCPRGLACEPVRDANACTLSSGCDAGGGAGGWGAFALIAAIGVIRHRRHRRAAFEL